MTVWLNQQALIRFIRSSQRLVDDMVVRPSRQGTDALVTDRANTVLFSPEVCQHSFTLQVVFHLYAQAFCKIDFPLWVIRITAPLDFDVSLDGCRVRQAAHVFLLLALLVSAFAKESPVLSPVRTTVFIFDPVTGLLGMPSACPLPQCFEDGRGYLAKGFVAYHVAVQIRPSSNFRIEQGSPRVGRGLLVTFNDSPDVRQERFCVLFRGLYQQLALVFAGYPRKTGQFIASVT